MALAGLAGTRFRQEFHDRRAQPAELPVDIVKLDRALVAGLAEGGERAEGILAAAVALVTSAGLDVVVEGVETTAELDTVRRLGCSVVQGYLLRRPGPAAEVLAECVGTAVPAPR